MIIFGRVGAGTGGEWQGVGVPDGGQPGAR